jgi:hypothetical protein
MKKFIRMSLIVMASAWTFQSCDDEETVVPPTLQEPATVAAVQVGTSADVEFTFVAAGGFKSAVAVATGGSVGAVSGASAGDKEGTLSVTFTADNTAGAGSVKVTLTDNSGNEVDATAILNKTISAPPSISLSLTEASGKPGTTVVVSAQVTAANGVKTLSISGIASTPASPIALTGASPVTQQVTLAIPANAVVGSIISAVFTAQDDQNLNSSPVTLNITVLDPTNVLTGTQTSNLTLVAGEAYLVKSQFIVAAGVTLTVEPGTVVKGDKATKGTIIIQPGATLDAEGTEANPIVFTSSQPVGARDRGDWGGIVWLGNAYVNQASRPAVEGISPSINYGTVDPAQASATVGENTASNGTLKYARIEYGGIELTPNNETNSLTMGALGSGTTVEYVQASFGGDDGFEWFGGTVNGKYLISHGMWDDDFDTDFGWRGNVQFGLVVRYPFAADQSGSTAFESDSQANGNPIGTVCDNTTKTGCTRGVFSNITVLGARDYSRTVSGNYTRAMHIRRRTAISIFNSVITGWPQGLTIDDNGTFGNYNATNTGEGRLANNVLFTSFVPASTSSTSTTAVTAIAAASNNSKYSTNATNFTVTDVTSIWEATAAGNTHTVPYFVSRFTSTGGVVTGQAISNTWAASSSTIAAADVAFSTIPGWTAGTAVDLGSPYAGTGIQTTAFFGSASPGSYNTNPDFSVASGSITGKTASTLFADAKLTGGFFNTDVTYLGAFGTTDWTNTWSEFQPLNKVY